MEYPKSHLIKYFSIYSSEYRIRYGKYIKQDILAEFLTFCGTYKPENKNIFIDWHNKEYLRVCMANLYEKWKFGAGNSKITDSEWKRLLHGYCNITHKEYVI